jgi:hypothetical protein
LNKPVVALVCVDCRWKQTPKTPAIYFDWTAMGYYTNISIYSRLLTMLLSNKWPFLCPWNLFPSDLSHCQYRLIHLGVSKYHKYIIPRRRMVVGIDPQVARGRGVLVGFKPNHHAQMAPPILL